MTKTESGGAAVAFMEPPGRRKKRTQGCTSTFCVRGQRVEVLLGTSGMDHVRLRCCAVLCFLSGNLMHPELLTNSIIGCISVFGFVTNPGAPTGVGDTLCHRLSHHSWMLATSGCDPAVGSDRTDAARCVDQRTLLTLPTCREHACARQHASLHR